MKRIELMSERDFSAVADKVLAVSTADHTRLYWSDSFNMTTRFANNQVIQNVAIRRPSLMVEVAFGQQVGRMTINKFDGADVTQAVAKAEEIARLSPGDPEYLEPLGPQKYDDFKTYSLTTANREPLHLADHVRRVVRKCKDDGCEGAGIVSANRSHVGVAASTGLRGFEQRTSSAFSLTATLPDSTGWAMGSHRKISSLGIRDRTQTAISKAKKSAKPVEIPAGKYDVILEPSAVVGLVGPMMWSISAKNYYKGNSPYAGNLGQQILDQRLTIESDPSNKLLLGTRFNGAGMPNRQRAWIDKGVLRHLYYDRFTAKEHNQEPTPFPGALRFSFEKPTASSLEELIRATKRGILVTNFWYIRYVNPTDLTLTGMTRDGTFLIENGEIVGGLRNFRFHESPLRVFKSIAGVTAAQEAVASERSKMLAPAVKLNDFNFSSVTRF